MVRIQKSEAVNKAIRNRLLQFVSPALILNIEDQETTAVEACGTFTLLEVNGQKYIATALHVWRGYLEAKKTKNVVFAIWFPNCDKPLDLSDCKPSDEIQGMYDLAIWKFDCDHDVGKEFAKVNQESSRVEDRDNCILIGFPSEKREDTGRMLTHQASVIEERVSKVDEHKFYMANESGNRDWKSEEGEHRSSSLGGISGCPVFRLREYERFVELELVGIQYEVYDAHQHGHDDQAMIRFQHVDIILGDGKFDHLRNC